MFVTFINIDFETVYLGGSEPGPGGSLVVYLAFISLPMVHQKFLEAHREFDKFLIKSS